MGCINQLKTTSEELNFERDELNEKNHALREQIKKLEDDLDQVHKVHHFLFVLRKLLFVIATEKEVAFLSLLVDDACCFCVFVCDVPLNYKKHLTDSLDLHFLCLSVTVAAF